MVTGVFYCIVFACTNYELLMEPSVTVSYTTQVKIRAATAVADSVLCTRLHTILVNLS